MEIVFLCSVLVCMNIFTALSYIQVCCPQKYDHELTHYAKVVSAADGTV